jgi:hypothetical protein
VLLGVGRLAEFADVVDHDARLSRVQVAPPLLPLVKYIDSRFAGADTQFRDIVLVQKAVLSGRTSCEAIQAAMESILARPGVCDDYKWRPSPD